MFLQLSLERDGAESIQGGEVKTKQIKTRVEVTEELFVTLGLSQAESLSLCFCFVPFCSNKL